MMPVYLPVCLIYAPIYFFRRRKRAPFAGKGRKAYVFLRVTVVLIAFVLFLVWGVAPPLSLLCGYYMKSAFVAVMIGELALLPFTLSAIIHVGIRLVCKLAHADMKKYIDYRAILFYVSVVIIAVWGLILG